MSVKISFKTIFLGLLFFVYYNSLEGVINLLSNPVAPSTTRLVISVCGCLIIGAIISVRLLEKFLGNLRFENPKHMPIFFFRVALWLAFFIVNTSIDWSSRKLHAENAKILIEGIMPTIVGMPFYVFNVFLFVGVGGFWVGTLTFLENKVYDSIKEETEETTL